jgi:hypothetical protein
MMSDFKEHTGKYVNGEEIIGPYVVGNLHARGIRVARPRTVAEWNQRIATLPITNEDVILVIKDQPNYPIYNGSPVNKSRTSLLNKWLCSLCFWRKSNG